MRIKKNKKITHKDSNLYYNEEINFEQGCIEINIHVENDDDLDRVVDEILALRDNFTFPTEKVKE